MEQIRIEKEAAYEFEEFVFNTKEINSKNLNAFECVVADKLKLKRVLTSNSHMGSRHHNSFASPPNRAGAKFSAILANNARDAIVGLAS